MVAGVNVIHASFMSQYRSCSFDEGPRTVPEIIGEFIRDNIQFSWSSKVFRCAHSHQSCLQVGGYNNSRMYRPMSNCEARASQPCCSEVEGNHRSSNNLFELTFNFDSWSPPAAKDRLKNIPLSRGSTQGFDGCVQKSLWQHQSPIEPHHHPVQKECVKHDELTPSALLLVQSAAVKNVHECSFAWCLHQQQLVPNRYSSYI